MEQVLYRWTDSTLARFFLIPGLRPLNSFGQDLQKLTKWNEWIGGRNAALDKILQELNRRGYRDRSLIRF